MGSLIGMHKAIQQTFKRDIGWNLKESAQWMNHILRNDMNRWSNNSFFIGNVMNMQYAIYERLFSDRINFNVSNTSSQSITWGYNALRDLVRAHRPEWIASVFRWARNVFRILILCFQNINTTNIINDNEIDTKESNFRSSLWSHLPSAPSIPSSMQWLCWLRSRSFGYIFNINF